MFSGLSLKHSAHVILNEAKDFDSFEKAEIPCYAWNDIIASWRLLLST